MKAYEIISMGFALAGESIEDWPDKDIALRWLNMAVAESLTAEKMIRARKKTGTAEVAEVKEMEDTVDMDSEICRICLPLYIAALLAADREKGCMAAEYRSRFEAALKAAAGAEEKAIADFYGGN